MALWSDAIGYGTHADRPAAGRPGALYFESDTGNGYRDNGTSWDLILAAPVPVPFAVQTMSSGDITVARGNTLVINTGSGYTATLPDAATYAGQWVIVKNQGGSNALVTPAGADTLDWGSSTYNTGGGGQACTMLLSDGAKWNILAHMSGD